MNVWKMLIEVMGGLGLFLYGMKVMSEGLQSVAGDELRTALKRITGNRISGVLTGIAVTGLIQSSSATTVMLVSFVNAGLINLSQSIGVIMGANIGTTVTAWLVALVGFKVKIAAFALPAIGVGFFLRFLGSDKLTYWGEVLVGFGILFLGLEFMKDAVEVMRDSEGVVDWMSRYRADSFGSFLMVLLVGTAVTMLVQSSSATMALTMALAVQGLMDFRTAAALILAQNIGTTITANLAAIGASAHAKRCARAHLLFNMIGVVLVMFVFSVVLRLVDTIVPGDVFSGNADIAVRALPAHMAAFHTIFNVANTILLLPFVTGLAFLARLMVREGEEEEPHLKFIDTGLMGTPTIALSAARRELQRMAEVVIRMFDKVMKVIQAPDTKLGPVVDEVHRSEQIVDMLDNEISSFLGHVAPETTSPEQGRDVYEMLSIANDLERIGDHCESLLKLARRRYDKNFELPSYTAKEITSIASRVRKFLELVKEKMGSPGTDIMTDAEWLEEEIDEMRRRMRKDHAQRINNREADVLPGLLFLDMLTSFEKIGDHAYNIAESISLKK